MSAYNAVDAKFDEVTSNDWTIFNYGSEAAFADKVDISVAGVIMDCGECHVGGGGMEFVPFSNLNARTSLRDITSGTANGTAITPAEYTAFNYFIDTYDVDGDGDEAEVMYMDYANTGVMEMDCLLCHMPGYDYNKRTELLRDGKVDATRAVPAGLAVENSATWAPASNTAPSGYGTMVTYDLTKFDTYDVSGTPVLRLSADWGHNNLVSVPDSVNCAYCHMNKPGVDWKKRGDNWAPEGQYDFNYEVHYNIGCMGCHERKPTALQPDTGVDEFTSVYGGPYPTQGVGLLGHDPAKGIAPFSSLYNNNDLAAFKKCEDCHVNGAGGREYAAPNPTAAHAAAGLTAKVVQPMTAADGTPAISHIDLMDCAACHSRKIDSFDWNGMGTGNNGNPMVDATGSDVAGRLTDHENDYVIKTDMTDRSSLSWVKGKLIRASYLNTMFYRDKQDTPLLDANLDGRPHGMDALLMTQVNKVNEANGWTSITEDNHGHVTAAMVNERITAMNAEVENWVGVPAGTAKTKLSMMHVAFKDQHGVSPAAQAWGAGGCTDCHDSGANFWNGAINTIGDGVTMYWDDDVVPFTKVNGFSQKTDMHPNVKDKFGKRSLATMVTEGTVNVGGIDYKTAVPFPRAATMYEATFKGPADYVTTASSSAAIGFSGFEKGWLLMVQARLIDQGDGTPGPVITRTKAVGVGGGSADVANVTELLASLGTFATDFEFQFVADGAGTGITINADSGYEFKLAGGVDSSGAFKLEHAAYKATPWTATDGTVANGRTDWVAYLNLPKSLPTAGVATISSVPATVEVGTTVQLIADEAVNADSGAVSYSWICNDIADEVLDGATVDKIFSTVGTWTVTLRVIDAFGDLQQVSQQVQVTAPAPLADIALVTPVQPAGSENTVSFSNLPAHTMLYIIWGDGLKQRVYDTAASVDVAHTFRMYSKYFDGSNYNYRTTVYVYNGSSRVDIKRETLSIAP